MHSSKAKSFIASGGWDTKDKIRIRLITGSHCNGRIGSTSISPSGINQFCGKYSCTISSRLKAQVQILPYYWYIQAGPKSMSRFFATPKLPSAKLGGPVNGLFEDLSKDPTHPTFTEITIGKCKLLFNYWKEYLIGNTSPILFPEETPIVPTLTVIASNLTGKLSPISPILEEMFALSTPSGVDSKPTIVELSTVLGFEADTEPPPYGKSSIKPGYWKAVLAQITKLELDRTAMTVVLYDFFNQRLSSQQYFNLLDRKSDDLKTDAEASII